MLGGFDFPPDLQQLLTLLHREQKQKALGPGAALDVEQPIVARRAAAEPKNPIRCPHQCSSCAAPQRKNGQLPTACGKCKDCCLRDRTASKFALRCASHVAGVKKAAAATAIGAGEAAAELTAQ